MKALINFYADVNEHSVNSLINFITQLVAKQTRENSLEEIIIQISSSGGSSDHGLLAYNYLRQLSVPKTTIGMGNVDSAAVMIFCAGEKRLAMQSCRLTLHEALTSIQGTFNGTKLHEIANLNERITSDYCKVIAGVTKKNLKTVEKDVKKGTVMSSEDGKIYKVVTEIQDQPYITDLNNLQIMMINNPQVPQQNLSGQNAQISN
jgi:ATP-dependent protease ClpP protease subunit